MVGALMVRAVVATLRIRVEDPSGALQRSHPLIWIFWHNRLFVIPHLFNKLRPGRPGAALTSASKDGEIVAAFLKQFRIKSVRGSSSRRGATAAREILRFVESGHEIGITPDGPRGPRYEIKAGPISLAENSGTPLLPVRIRYSRFWQIKSWDRFMIPKPFSRVDVTILPPEFVAQTTSDADFEAERLRIEGILRQEQIES